MFLLDPTGWRGVGPRAWAWAFAARVGGVYQPLAYLSYGLDYVLWGLDPRGYHLQSALWHAAAAGCLALLARRLLLAAAPRRTGEPRWAPEAAAALAAAAFALHPLRVESVTWISERRDVVCAALSLACVWAYVRARQERRSETPALALFFLSLLAKGMALTLPVVLVIVDYYPLKRPRPLRDKAPYLLLSAVFALIGSAIQERLRWSWEQHGLPARLAQSAYAAVFYPLKTLWPTDLSPFYELRPPLDLLEARFAASLAAVLFAAWACARALRSRPWLAASAAAYAVMLLPVSGLFQFGPQLVADRYAYLPTVPAFLLLAAGLRGALARSRVLVGGAAGAGLTALAAACVLQQSHWRSTEALWSRVLALDPGNGSARLSRGVERARAGRPAEAEAEFHLALAAFPGCAAQQERLAALGPGAAGEEAERLRRRVEWNPVCRKARANLGAALAAQGRLEEAGEHLRVAAAIEPDNEGARRNLARLAALKARGGRPAGPRKAARR